MNSMSLIYYLLLFFFNKNKKNYNTIIKLLMLIKLKIFLLLNHRKISILSDNLIQRDRLTLNWIINRVF